MRVQSSYLAVFAACVLAIVSPAARAFQMHPVQPPGHTQATLESLADEIAAAIADVKENPVIVFDFAGPDELTSASEKSLADDFSAAMARMNKEIVILDRAQITDVLQNKNLSLADLEDPRDAQEVAKELKAKSYVWAAIVLGQDNFEMLVEALRVQDGKKIAGFQTTLPLTDQMKALADTRVSKNLEPGVAHAGTQGVTYPACIYCPQAQYTRAAVQHHFEGTVLLSIVITADGHADDILALRALPYGLTESAIETVKSWRLKPGQTSDGTPMAVRQRVEITFHLY
ncbi:MAG: energy transducer TonB [Candidatus Acidiferrales bacterium]